MYPGAVQEYYVARLREVARQRDEALAALRTADDATRYCAAVKQRLRECFAPWPDATPLNARVTSTRDRGTYLVENVLFESRPGYFVTANLYCPPHAGRHPAVLGLCGHVGEGKAAPPYVQYGRTLAAMGYVVLILDPVSQGERRQYDDIAGDVTRGQPCVEHNLAGNQMTLVGEALCTWRTWDAVRALDYLLSRPEVDAQRVGVTGNSGGGTLSTYLNAMDDRLTMAAPGCFVSTYLANLENELPADSEQYPPGILAAGLDMGDFFLAQAPRPVLLLGQAFDFFDTRGLRKTFEQIQRVYELLGAGDNAELFIGPSAHGYTAENRAAMYAFFNKHADVSAAIVESDKPVDSEQDLQVTPTGAVAELPDNRRVFDFTAEAARRLIRSRPRFDEGELDRQIARTLHLSPRQGAPHYRVLRDRYGAYSDPFQNVQLYGVETEPEHPQVLAVLQAWNKINPLKGKPNGGLIPVVEDAVLYVPHVSSRDDLLRGEVPAAVEATIFAVDPRGMGMLRPLSCSDTDFFAFYGADYMYAGHGAMLQESYCGRRVHDVLSVLDLLASRGTRRVHLMGRGLGAVLAAFAAALHPLVRQVTLKHAPPSFQHLAEASLNLWPLSSLPRGILQVFDLPDVYRRLEAKHLSLTEPWDPRMAPLIDSASTPGSPPVLTDAAK